MFVYICAVEQPRSRVIFRDPVTQQWVDDDTAYLQPLQPLYIACQTYREELEVAQPIAKTTGPPLDRDNIRIQ